MIIKWRTSYEIGIPSIDEQHKKLVDLINVMFEVMRNRREVDEVAKAVEEVIAYTKYHFIHEEEEMEAAGYPQLAEHKKEHAKLIQKTTKFYELAKLDPDEMSTDFYTFLRVWLLDHILESDAQYVPFVKKKEVSRNS